jgi:hypothetical protein
MSEVQKYVSPEAIDYFSLACSVQPLTQIHCLQGKSYNATSFSHNVCVTTDTTGLAELIIDSNFMINYRSLQGLLNNHNLTQVIGYHIKGKNFTPICVTPIDKIFDYYIPIMNEIIAQPNAPLQYSVPIIGDSELHDNTIQIQTMDNYIQPALNCIDTLNLHPLINKSQFGTPLTTINYDISKAIYYKQLAYQMNEFSVIKPPTQILMYVNDIKSTPTLKSFIQNYQNKVSNFDNFDMSQSLQFVSNAQVATIASIDNNGLSNLKTNLIKIKAKPFTTFNIVLNTYMLINNGEFNPRSDVIDNQCSEYVFMLSDMFVKLYPTLEPYYYCNNSNVGFKNRNKNNKNDENGWDIFVDIVWMFAQACAIPAEIALTPIGGLEGLGNLIGVPNLPDFIFNNQLLNKIKNNFHHKE